MLPLNWQPAAQVPGRVESQSHGRMTAFGVVPAGRRASVRLAGSTVHVQEGGHVVSLADRQGHRLQRDGQARRLLLDGSQHGLAESSAFQVEDQGLESGMLFSQGLPGRSTIPAHGPPVVDAQHDEQGE